MLITYFLWQITNYIANRKKLKKYSQLLQVDDRWDEEYIKLNKWLFEIIDQEKEIRKNFHDKNNNNDKINDQLKISPFFETLSSSSSSPLCRELALLVPDDIASNEENNKNICAEMTREVCGLDSQFVEKIKIPENKSDFIAANGMHLLSGETYCIFKKPPLNSLSSSSSSVKCNERWGYWKFSPVQDRWLCHSKVPGIYNAERDEFSPCKAGNGKFIIDNIEISPEQLETEYEPRQFYDIEFQKRCGCLCDEKMGYIFVPDKSRTTCFKDPCRSALPPFSAAPGYVNETGHCDCGIYFTNLFNDKKQPCTACPFDRPQYDEKNHILTVFIKCGNKDSYLFPCESDEDEIRGCRKAIIQVKPMERKSNEDDSNEKEKREKIIIEETFEERMFW